VGGQEFLLLFAARGFQRRLVGLESNTEVASSHFVAENKLLRQKPLSGEMPDLMRTGV